MKKVISALIITTSIIAVNWIFITSGSVMIEETDPVKQIIGVTLNMGALMIDVIYLFYVYIIIDNILSKNESNKP